MRKTRKFWSDQDGGSAVEFALVVPFLLVVIFCIFELSWLMASQAVLNHATFQAARIAAKARGAGKTEAEAQSAAKSSAAGTFWMGDLDTDEVDVTFDDSGTVPQVKVQSAYAYESLTGWFDDDDVPDELKAKAVTPLP
jgi:Flp pilus assembly protein TadG